MRKLLYIVFFICSFAQSQMIIDSYKFDSGVTPFFLNNVLTPSPNEENDTDAIDEAGQTANASFAIVGSPVQDGSYALQVTCSADITTSYRIRLEFTGLENGASYTATVYLREETGDSFNMWARMNSAEGWVSSTSSALSSSQTYIQETVGGTTDATTAYLWIEFTTAFDNTEIAYIDNVVLTKD